MKVSLLTSGGYGITTGMVFPVEVEVLSVKPNGNGDQLVSISTAEMVRVGFSEGCIVMPSLCFLLGIECELVKDKELVGYKIKLIKGYKKGTYYRQPLRGLTRDKDLAFIFSCESIKQMCKEDILNKSDHILLPIYK